MSIRVRISKGDKIGMTAVCVFSSTFATTAEILSLVGEAEAYREKSMIFVAATEDRRMMDLSTVWSGANWPRSISSSRARETSSSYLIVEPLKRSAVEIY